MKLALSWHGVVVWLAVRTLTREMLACRAHKRGMHPWVGIELPWRHRAACREGVVHIIVVHRNGYCSRPMPVIEHMNGYCLLAWHVCIVRLKHEFPGSLMCISY